MDNGGPLGAFASDAGAHSTIARVRFGCRGAWGHMAVRPSDLHRDLRNGEFGGHFRGIREFLVVFEGGCGMMRGRCLS